ncbi:unnamed protein product [Mytilus coruscus]|uniref:Uncharacterized protein n=1 Tax=Mytilus coruscus TaxID=42192 RepID=A0A6J8EBL1_MYTCO|nr:unnamed protein product [Mytilus coruscus]
MTRLNKMPSRWPYEEQNRHTNSTPKKSLRTVFRKLFDMLKILPPLTKLLPEPENSAGEHTMSLDAITNGPIRRSNKRLKELQRNTIRDSNQDIVVPEYDGLNYNVLYVSAEQQVDIDINYSTVDFERSQTSTRHSEIENHYNTVEINAEHSSLKRIQESKLNIEKETSNSSNEYAVVDKRLRNPIQILTRKIQDGANPEQAYTVVDKT